MGLLSYALTTGAIGIGLFALVRYTVVRPHVDLDLQSCGCHEEARVHANLHDAKVCL